MPDFPADFVWGAAAAAYQIEGAHDLDGKGPSVWDAFCERPGAIWNGDDGRVACDHYRRYAEDVELLAALGVDAYRSSVSWPRVLPEGTGTPNERGLDFYDRLIDALLARDIEPYVTLFHWDYPLALFQRGGWLHPDSPRWFADYTELLARRLGDRVKQWLTLNEPHAFIEGGLRDGRHAPGLTLPIAEVVQAGHHALLAHGHAVRVLRSLVPGARIGCAPVLVAAAPATPSAADVAAAERWTWQMPHTRLRVSSWWMDPIYRGHYPEDGLRALGRAAPRVSAGDFDLIAQPLDYLGCNLYDVVRVRANAEGEPEEVPFPQGFPRTAFGWPVTPEGMYWGPRFAHARYGLPVLITENGMSNRDWVALDGAVHDPERVDFLRRHLAELARAVADGVPVLGYFHWSLLDNFEWNHGYRERFGLVHVDYATGTRTPKDSARAYAAYIAAQRPAAG
ncbi:MAG: beta-glucosidase [Myxococcales bacterium]|jgi:beta-glucosidase|nr:beta-glucosidase [Myxococcales bacterium]